MNERIRELAEQANEEHNNFYDLDHNNKMGFLEDFTKLIVQECANRLRSEVEFGKAQMTTANAYKLAFMSQAADIIEEHLGVEE